MFVQCFQESRFYEESYILGFKYILNEILATLHSVVSKTPAVCLEY